MKKLHVGSGYNRYDGYLNCDNDPTTKPDLLFDLESDRYPLDDNTVESVIAHHVFEHLGEGYIHCLKELYRVCVNEALIDVRVPHPRSDTFLADPTHQRPITPLGLSLFSKEYNQWCDDNGYPASQLARRYDIDFKIVHWNYIFNDSYRNLLENKSPEEIQQYIDLYNNIVSEFYIKLKVIKDD